MPASKIRNRIGKTRWEAVVRILWAIAFFGLISIITGTIGGLIALIWAILDIGKILIYNERLEWGKAWPKAILVWNYDMILWIMGFCEYPGPYPTPRRNA